MHRGHPPLGLSCPSCGSALEPVGQGTDDQQRLQCPGCGGTFTARRRKLPVSQGVESMSQPPAGGPGLALRMLVLRLVPLVYRLGLVIGTTILFIVGGFVPVIRAWLDNRVESLPDIASALGGTTLSAEHRNPDNDLGPLLRRADAPELFDLVAEVARFLGVRPPEEIRLAFLPCCGVVAWRRSRALLLGLPLLDVLTVGELRAVVAHELSHLAKGDATWSAQAKRFVERLGQALEEPGGNSWGPLRAWARVCLALASSCSGPIALGQEIRADRTAAALAGGAVAASSLVKVALVQPLFRELLDTKGGALANSGNLYRTFRQFWNLIPEPLLASMRMRLLVTEIQVGDSPHPPLPDRVARAQAVPDRPEDAQASRSAFTLLGDPEWLEQMLHDRLFRLNAIEPSVFHRAGS